MMVKPCKTCDHAIFCHIWGEVKCKLLHRRMKNGGPDSCKHYLKTVHRGEAADRLKPGNPFKVTDGAKCQCESCQAAGQEDE